jgi:hypothetical protein
MARWAAIDDDRRTTDRPFLTGSAAENLDDNDLEADRKIDTPVGKKCERDRWITDLVRGNNAGTVEGSFRWN